MKDDFLMMYDRYYDDIYRYVLYKTGSRWDTDDLVSDIFRKALQSYERSAVSVVQQKKWLVAIARNTVIDYYRRRKEEMYGHDPEVLGYKDVQAVLDETDIKHDCLKLVLQNLEPADQEMINLKYIAGLRYREISEIKGQDESKLKMKVHRIKQKMARLITACLEG